MNGFLESHLGENRVKMIISGVISCKKEMSWTSVKTKMWGFIQIPCWISPQPPQVW